MEEKFVEKKESCIFNVNENFRNLKKENLSEKPQKKEI